VEEGAKILMGTATRMGEGGGGDGVAGTINDDDVVVYDEDGDGGPSFSMDEDDEKYGSPLMGMADSVLSDIMSSQTGPQTPMEHIQAFSAAITWNEPFIQCLIAFHVLVVFFAIMISRRGGLYCRMVFMVFIGIIVRMAERLNNLGASRWRDFSTQNYFDKNGIFMGIMVCAPLLFVCFGILISMIREASNLLVDVKKMKMQATQEQKKSKNDGKRKKNN